MNSLRHSVDDTIKIYTSEKQTNCEQGHLMDLFIVVVVNIMF